MKIEYLRVKNFKAFKDAEMKDIPGFCGGLQTDQESSGRNGGQQ